jgi:glycosyltransferase involved in cell wall biosynthesis
MRIAIDARFASGKITGVGKYCVRLVESIDAMSVSNEIILLVNSDSILTKNSKIIKTSITPEMHPLNELWENITLPYYLKKNRINLFHSPAFFLPLFSPGTKKIVTIHDLAVFKFPETFTYKFSKYLQLMICLSTRFADRIIVDSGAVKKDIIDILKVREEKISVIYPGIDDVFLREGKGEIDKFKEARNLTQGFILYAGTIEPRKNLVNLIKAFSILKERGLKQKLVIAGKRGWLYERIIEEVKRSKFKGDIVFTDYIFDVDLKLYYSNCDVFVYPSLYEGFGLPTLEALACGAPVVVPDIPVFREVLDESALFVQPESPESIADGIERILTDGNLRERIMGAGRGQVKKYSWNRTAIETMKVYQEIVRG